MLKKYKIEAENDDDNDTDSETFESARHRVAQDLSIIAAGVGHETFYDEAMSTEQFYEEFN